MTTVTVVVLWKLEGPIFIFLSKSKGKVNMYYKSTWGLKRRESKSQRTFKIKTMLKNKDRTKRN